MNAAIYERELDQDQNVQFSLSIIQLYRLLTEGKEFIISKQLLRSATSIGANVVETEAGISKADFIAKMSIASKEARETRYWLELLEQSYFTKQDLKMNLNEVNEIIKVITSIVKTAQEQK